MAHDSVTVTGTVIYIFDLAFYLADSASIENQNQEFQKVYL